MLVPQKIHNSNGSLFDDLPFDQFERVPIDLQSKQFHKPEHCWQFGEVIVLQVQVVEWVLRKYLVRNSLDAITADIQNFEKREAVILPEGLDGGDGIVG